nr:DUF5753 domain-containing protein [Planosporangium thailandense]
MRAELLGATAADNGEGAWIVRTGRDDGHPDPGAAPGFGTARIRHHQPVQLPGLLRTREYARAVAQATGDSDPDARADAWMRRQEVLTTVDGVRYEVVLDARALLLAVAPVEAVRHQILSLAVRARRLPRLDLRVIPIGRPLPVFASTGFMMYDFRAAGSRPLVRVECPAGDAFFAAPDDITRYAALFAALQSAALDPTESAGYLRSLAADLERYWPEPAAAAS